MATLYKRPEVKREHEGSLWTSNIGLVPNVGDECGKSVGLKLKRHETEDSVRQTLNHYNVIINSTNDAIIRKTLDGVITGWSRGAETIFGYTRAEMIGQSIRRLLPHARLVEEARLFARVKQGDEVKPFDTIRLRKDGSRIHVSISISPIPDDVGNVTGISTIIRDITERVRIEEALIAREREFHQLAETVPQIVWVARPDGWNTYFNQRWVDYTGLTLEESHGHGWNKPLHPDDLMRARDAWESAVHAGSGYSLECRLRRADGVYHWWLLRGVPLVDETGQITKWHGTCTDIQDLKTAELDIVEARRTLAESESQFRGAFEAAAQGMALVSTEGRFLRVNQALCNMLGYAEAEILQKRIQEITHPDDIKIDLDDMRALILGDIDSYHTEKRLYHERGAIVWVQLIVSLARSSTGDPIHFVSQIQDIGQRRAAKQVLQEASDLLEAAPDAMIAVGTDGTIRFGNLRAVAMFGRTKAELSGQPIDLLIPDRLRSGHPDHMAAYFAAAKRREMGVGRQLFAHDRDGAEFPIEVSLSPVEINGEALVVAAVRDITARRRLEETLDAARAQMVAAARLSAHEINNPVAVIHALASDLAEQGDILPPDVVEGGQRIVEYADRVANIVRSLRHITRDAVRDPFDEASVSGIVGQALDLCKERFRQHSVALLTSPIDPAIRLLCREVQVSQMLVNLLQNAFDAVQEQGNQKWVRLEVVAQGDRVTISVIDSGKGVPSELRERIMEPFFTTKPIGKGTGLGLSLSRQIAEVHGGTLELNERGGHTCFSIILPASNRGTQACD
jgi:PAS domain S-box-containing protein